MLFLVLVVDFFVLVFVFVNENHTGVQTRWQRRRQQKASVQLKNVSPTNVDKCEPTVIRNHFIITKSREPSVSSAEASTDRRRGILQFRQHCLA